MATINFKPSISHPTKYWKTNTDTSNVASKPSPFRDLSSHNRPRLRFLLRTILNQSKFRKFSIKEWKRLRRVTIKSRKLTKWTNDFSQIKMIRHYPKLTTLKNTSRLAFRRRCLMIHWTLWKNRNWIRMKSVRERKNFNKKNRRNDWKSNGLF